MMVTGTHGIAPSITVTVGNGKATHWGSDCGTICGAGAGKSCKVVRSATVTCKRCVKLMALQIEVDHDAALLDNAKHEDAKAVVAADVQPAQQWVRVEDGAQVEVTRVAAHPYPRVSFRHADGSTGTLPLPWFVETYSKAQATAKPQSRPLDIWLGRGVVLVDPLTGDLMTFECWNSQGALLRNNRTGAQHAVTQSLVTTWEYVPSASPVPASTGGLKLTVHALGGEAFAVPLADGKLLLGVGDVGAPRQAITLTAEQLAELRCAMDTEDEKADDFGL